MAYVTLMANMVLLVCGYLLAGIMVLGLLDYQGRRFYSRKSELVAIVIWPIAYIYLILFRS